MTLTQLRAFLAVATLGTFSAAAAELQMAQPSISELIHRLEHKYGVKLFSRGPRGMIPTDAAAELLPIARQAVANADEADRALRSMRSLAGGAATFGLLRNANYYLLSRLLDRFHERYPEVKLRIIGLNSVEVAEAVTAGEIEAGLVVLPIDAESLQVTPLRRDEVVAVSANERDVAEPMTIQRFAEHDLVLYDAHYGWRDPTRRQLAERAQLAGVTLDPIIEVEHVELALSLVSRGAGITLVSRAVAQSNVFPADLHTGVFAEPLYDTVAIVQRRDTVLSPATREIARLARRMLLER